MATDTQIDPMVVAEVSEAKACESGVGCQFEASYMVWCDHHKKGCDYTGYRCDIHFNLLYQETVRQMKAIDQGWLSLCDRCGKVVISGQVSDHLRWVRL